METVKRRSSSLPAAELWDCRNYYREFCLCAEFLQNKKPEQKNQFSLRGRPEGGQRAPSLWWGSPFRAVVMNAIGHGWANMTNLRLFASFSFLCSTSQVPFFFILNFLKPVSGQEKESWLVLSLPNCCHTPDPGSLSWLLLGPHQQNWIASAFFQFLTCRHFAHQGWACSDRGWIAGHGILPFLHLIWLLCTLPKKLQWHLAGLPRRTLWRHLVTFVSQVHWSYFESCLGSQGQVRCSVIWGLFSEAI